MRTTNQSQWKNFASGGVDLELQQATPEPHHLLVSNHAPIFTWICLPLTLDIRECYRGFVLQLGLLPPADQKLSYLSLPLPLALVDIMVVWEVLHLVSALF